MNFLEGPRLYYSLFGVRGPFLGARARLLRRPIEVAVAVPGMRHPVCLRLRTTDVAVCREILLNGQYDWDFSRSPQVIVDVGANVGLASIFYANKYPSSRIVAIEPEPSNYEMLRRNVAPYPNIVSMQVALWKEERLLDVLDPGTGHTTFRMAEIDESGDVKSRQTIRGMTLGKLMADLGIHHIDLLKVDVEGSEKEIFEHSSSWIDKVGVIAIEIHDWIQGGCGDSVHTATKDFELEWQKGETTYFARKAYTSNGASSTRAHVNAPNARHYATTPKIPLRILNIT
jgi:FkbM family methyltransferase